MKLQVDKFQQFIKIVLKFTTTVDDLTLEFGLAPVSVVSRSKA
jgi:hypothetical protein